MDQENRTDYLNVHIEGDVSGQIAIGENILQIGDVHGGVINIIQPGKKPTFKRRGRPVMIRPRRFSNFLDRVAELDIVVGALNRGEPVSMYAANGMGKTTLLRQLAYDAPGDNFPDGILYMPAHINCIEDLLQIIFDRFYESDSPALPTPAELRGFLQEIEALIILDDALLNREDVTELINSLPRSVVVLSSSERCLWGEGCCMELRGLPLEETLTLVESELKRKITTSELAFAEILHGLGKGQPLFMIQAAALVREGKSFEEIISALKVPGEGLAQVLAGRLNETQNRILSFLDSLKEIAVPKKHLTGLSGAKDLESDINLLRKLSFVRETRTTISLAGPLILPMGPLAHMDWEASSFDYFVRWLQEAPSLFELRESLDLLLFLLGRAVSASRWDVVITLGKGIERTLILSGLWSTWSQVLGWILEAARSLSDKALQAWALHQLGARSLCLGDLSAAQSFLAQALSLREALGDQAASALTRQALGTTPTPPTVPLHVPAPHPGLTSWSALSPVVKVALLVGGTAMAATAIVLSNSTTRVPPKPPESPAAVSQAPVEEPGLIAVNGKTETPVLIKTPIWTKTPVSTKTPVPTSTEALIGFPIQDECNSSIKFVVARQLQYDASIAFDVPFDIPPENIDSDRNIDMGGKLTVYVNEKEVTDYRTGLYDPTRPDRLFILLPELDLDDNVHIQLSDNEALYCSPVDLVDWIDPYVEPVDEIIDEEEPPAEEPAYCVTQNCGNNSFWDPSMCCCAIYECIPYSTCFMVCK